MKQLCIKCRISTPISYPLENNLTKVFTSRHYQLSIITVAFMLIQLNKKKTRRYLHRYFIANFVLVLQAFRCIFAISIITRLFNLLGGAIITITSSRYWVVAVTAIAGSERSDLATTCILLRTAFMYRGVLYRMWSCLL